MPLGFGYSVATEVEDLRRWLDFVQASGHLVAHNYGGLIAVEAVRLSSSVSCTDPVRAGCATVRNPAATKLRSAQLRRTTRSAGAIKLALHAGVRAADNIGVAFVENEPEDYSHGDGVLQLLGLASVAGRANSYD